MRRSQVGPFPTLFFSEEVPGIGFFQRGRDTYVAIGVHTDIHKGFRVGEQVLILHACSCCHVDVAACVAGGQDRIGSTISRYDYVGRSIGYSCCPVAGIIPIRRHFSGPCGLCSEVLAAYQAYKTNTEE